jgi:SAM-dependent methyltransferase
MERRVSEKHVCPLCGTNGATEYYRDGRRCFYQCAHCELVFVSPDQFLSLEEEKAEYDLHCNSPDDAGYRRFLSRTYLPMQARLAPASIGLDFGSGPGPTLSVMFAEAGHHVSIYDSFYARDSAIFDRTYDFITATEVVEHLHHPMNELDRLWRCLRPDGLLGIMTKMVIDREAFSGWHYKNDMTHVCFYSETTFNWLAMHWNAGLEFVDKDVVIFKKQFR